MTCRFKLAEGEVFSHIGIYKNDKKDNGNHLAYLKGTLEEPKKWLKEDSKYSYELWNLNHFNAIFKSLTGLRIRRISIKSAVPFEFIIPFQWSFVKVSSDTNWIISFVTLLNMTFAAPPFSLLSFVKTNSTPQREAQRRSYLKGLQSLKVHCIMTSEIDINWFIIANRKHSLHWSRFEFEHLYFKSRNRLNSPWTINIITYY